MSAKNCLECKAPLPYRMDERRVIFCGPACRNKSCKRKHRKAKQALAPKPRKRPEAGEPMACHNSECGAIFTPYHFGNRLNNYCSRKCRLRVRYLAYAATVPKRAPVACACCGEAFVPANRRIVNCSPECKRTADRKRDTERARAVTAAKKAANPGVMRNCQACDKVFDAGPNGYFVHCSNECRHPEPTGATPCQACGQLFDDKRGGRLYCRPACKRAAEHAIRRTGRSLLAVAPRPKAKPGAALPCASCAHGKPSAISETGYECRLERVTMCGPYGKAVLWRAVEGVMA